MLIIKNGRLMDPASGLDGLFDILIDEGKIAKIGLCGTLDEMAMESAAGGEITNIDAAGCVVAPGLVDGHVHFREPGYTYKEDIESGARAAARGGVTSVIMMGNTKPPMDNEDTIMEVRSKGAKTGIRVYACGNVTKEMAGKELTDMRRLSEVGAVLFTDDGKPIVNENIMERACAEAAKLGKVISLHEENPEYIRDNGINAGDVAARLGLEGASRQAEISMVERDIEIAKRTGAGIIVQHISAKESVDMIRQAKKEGVKVYAEATPHHFTLTEDAVLKYGSLAKMNPPLRLESDRMAIIDGLKDGAIDMVATDHAPHSREEKAKDFKLAPSGITGLETSLSLGIRELVRPGYLALMELIDRMTISPARVYGIDAGYIKEGGIADIIIFSPDKDWSYVQSVSKSSNTPFLGEMLPGRICCTICRGEVVYSL